MESADCTKSQDNTRGNGQCKTGAPIGGSASPYLRFGHRKNTPAARKNDSFGFRLLQKFLTEERRVDISDGLIAADFLLVRVCCAANCRKLQKLGIALLAFRAPRKVLAQFRKLGAASLADASSRAKSLEMFMLSHGLPPQRAKRFRCGVCPTVNSNRRANGLVRDSNGCAQRCKTRRYVRRLPSR